MQSALLPMMTPDSLSTLSIAYTYGIRGDLGFLARLATRLKQLRPLLGTPLLLDLGASCAPNIWHCDATQGRSMVVALDGVGYHALNLSEQLDETGRHKLEGIVTAGMVTARHAWRLHLPPHQDEGIVVASAPLPTLRLCIVCTPAPQTHLEAGVLTLQAPPAYQLGVVHLSLSPHPALLSQAIYTVPEDTPPDPSIAASLAFIEDEARDALRRRSD